jgi:heat shock protein HslJ
MLLLAGCASSGSDTDAIRGIWLLESFAVGGATEQVESGVNTADLPWVEIGEALKGDAGCNHFETMSDIPYSYDEGLLFAGEGFQTEVACRGNDGEDLMRVERLLMDTLWGSPVGVRVEVGGGSMTWRAGNTELFFVQVPTPPEPTPAPPPSSMGKLDCSPGIIVETQVVDDLRPTEQILLETVPQVVRAEEDPDYAPPAPAAWFYWGYDAVGNPIAFIARGDVEPPQYQVFTCGF